MKSHISKKVIKSVLCDIGTSVSVIYGYYNLLGRFKFSKKDRVELDKCLLIAIDDIERVIQKLLWYSIS